MRPAPPVETRTAREFFNEFARTAPFYTPEWLPEQDRGAGGAITRVAAAYLQEIADRLNQTPHKNLIAYLNMMGAQRRPAKPARTPLRFELSAGSTEAVIIPAGTRVSGANGLLFETGEGFSATPTRLCQAIRVGERGRLYDFRSILQEKAEGEVVAVVDRHLYLSWAELAEPGQEWEMAFLGENLHLLDPALGGVRWQYLVGKGQPHVWQDFEKVRFRQGHAKLRKPAEPVVEGVIAGQTGRWVRIVLAENASGLRLETVSLVLPPGMTNEGVIPMAAVMDSDGTLPADQPFYPFGERPAPFATCFLACPIFTRKGQKVRLRVALAEAGVPAAGTPAAGPPGADTRLAWEYWNGSAWHDIPGVGDGTALFTQDGEVQFTAPADWQSFPVMGKQDYWLRIRIVAGGYGGLSQALHEDRLWIEDRYQAPRVACIRCSCEPRRPHPDSWVAKNLLHWRRLEPPVGKSVRPFPNPAPAGLYLCFDRAPSGSALRLFCHLNQSRWRRDPHQVTWEYPCDAGAWRRLPVHDGTRGMNQSGVLGFAAPDDWAPSHCFGRSGFWLRALLNSRQSLPLKGLYTNTIWAFQSETVRGERPEPAPEDSGFDYQLKWRPVLAHDVWVNELDEDPGDLGSEWETRREYDENQRLIAHWVKWRPARFLKTGSADDRIYLLDPLSGGLRFGDGTHGRRPPAAFGKIRVDYRFGGGHAGNMEAGAVQTLHTAMPFVARVYNPLPAGGGADSEPVAAVLARGPARFVHRDRAVTAADYELLAQEANQRIARAHCLRAEGGILTLVIVPRGSDDCPRPVSQLCAQVADFVGQRAPHPLRDRIQVRGPRYLPLAVRAEIHTPDPSRIATLEDEARSRLRAFLHPLSGGKRGRGWPLGSPPSPRDIEYVLAGIEDVWFKISHLWLQSPDREAAPVDLLKHETGEVVFPTDALVANGKHRFTVIPGSKS